MQLVELAPEDLRSAALTAQWEDRLARIAKGQERDAKFVEEMRAYASRLVAAVKASDAKYTHDNQTRKTCPTAASSCCSSRESAARCSSARTASAAIAKASRR